MNFQEITQPQKLDRYSFLWSEIRLLVAAVALFAGGVPSVFLVIRQPFPLLGTLLSLSWIISGAVSGYLLYRWFQSKQMLFGAKDNKDLAAFIISTISGINLGIVGLTGKNIGMTISNNKIAFLIVGLMYIAAAAYLYKRWSERGQRLF